MNKGVIAMSEVGRERLRLLEAVSERRIKQGEAARRLGISVRQVKRLLREYRKEGAAGVVSKRRGKAPNNRISDKVKEAVLSRIRDRYRDFGPTQAAEYLDAEGIKLSKETLRQWMIADGLREAPRALARQPHPPRPRRMRMGELVQIDGSPHDWFEGRGPRCCLIAFIDDATSRVMTARFVAVESTQAYLDCTHAYILAYGCPAAFYSDRHGIFTKHDPEDGEPTQFQRALASLGVEGIQALTPQAKGRVERLFQTLQDRLVKAMRLAGICNMDDANLFLPGYLEKHNTRFAVDPAVAEDAHRVSLWNPGELARICSIQHGRKLSKDLVITFNRQRYILQTGGAPRYALRGQTVTVVAYPGGKIELLHGQEILPFKVFDETQTISMPEDGKTLNQRVDNVLKRRNTKPAANHPWRHYPQTQTHSSPATNPTRSGAVNACP